MSYMDYKILHELIKCGKLENFKTYFYNLGTHKQRLVVRTPNKYSQDTLLHDACRFGFLEIVQLLVHECGASINVWNNKNQSPIIIAIGNQSEEIVEKLAPPESLQLCLSIVKILKHIEENNFEQLTMSWNADCNVVNFQSYGVYLMTVAAYKGSIDILKFLMENGFSIDERSGQGMVPVLSACKHGHFELFKFLIENGCNMKVKNKDGDTPLMYACKGGNMNIVYYLLNKDISLLQDRNSIGRTVLMSAVFNVDIVKLLVNLGCKVDEEDLSGFTALICAVYAGKVETIKYLLSVGSDISSCTRDGRMSSIHFACKHGFVEVVKVLDEAGYSLIQKSINGNTPLMWAVLYGHLEVAKYLMSKGCKFTCDREAETALQMAKERGYFEIIAYIKNQTNN